MPDRQSDPLCAAVRRIRAGFGLGPAHLTRLGVGALLALGCALPAGAQGAGDAVTLKPFEHQYDVVIRGYAVGTGTMTLAATGNGCYSYTLATRPTAMVRLITGSPVQQSRFCVASGQLRPVSYRYSGAKVGEAGFALQFSADGRTVTGGKPGIGPRQVPADAVDFNSLAQVIRLWVIKGAAGRLSVTVVNDDDTTPYQFARTGTERLTVPGGSFDTVKVERVGPGAEGKKVTFWIAPSLDYTPVRMSDVRDGKVRFMISLAKNG